jgi:hypothetical protein
MILSGLADLVVSQVGTNNFKQAIRGRGRSTGNRNTGEPSRGGACKCCRHFEEIPLFTPLPRFCCVSRSR